jgi:hypothetical protein
MKIILISDSDKFINLNSTLVPAPTKLKVQNGLKKFGLFFGLAVVSVFIPVLHFVLVPAFLIVSVAAFFYGYKVKYQIVNPKPCTCLLCSHPLNLPVLLGDNRRLNCSSCTAQYRIND